MKRLKITNKLATPYGARTAKGVVTVLAGQTIEADFDDGEAAAVFRNSAVWRIDGGEIVAKVDSDRSQLAAIAALFGDPNVIADTVHDAVAALLASVNGDPQSRADAADKVVTIKDAVAMLDDGEPDHWTQAGKPAIAAVEKIIGRAVTRDEVDAVGRVRVI